MQDARYALRLLARNPGFTLIAVTTLALGIGANTAIFSVVNAALVRPLPYPDASHLVIIWDRLAKLGLDEFPVSYANYLDYKRASRAFVDIAGFSDTEFNLTTADQAERVPGMRVSANLLPMLGATPALGRLFTPEENEPGRGNAVVLSDALWRRRFGADPSLPGKRVTLDGGAFTVVGILQPGFSFSAGNVAAPEIWAPVTLRADPGRTTGALVLIARLKPALTLAEARADMQAVSGGVEERFHPYRGPHGEDAGYGVTVAGLRDQLYGGARRGLLVLLGAVGFVLLISCANIANLLLTRTAERRREIAVRKALGAEWQRLARQLLTESLVLSLAGGVLGLALAFLGAGLLSALMPAGLAHLGGIPIDGRVLVFTLLVSLGTGLAFGLAPVLHGSGMHLNEALRQAGRSNTSGRRSGRLRKLLVAGEFALSLILVIGAGLLLKSFSRLMSINPGFRTEKLITARISLAADQYRESHRVAAFYRELVERLRALPEVRSASVVSRLPLTGGSGGDPFSIEGRPYDAHGKTPQVVNQQVIGTDYFRTMQIPLIAGRPFTEREPEPAVIVNETMAHGFWPGQDPLGRRILLGAPRPGAPWLTIVGVVGDVRNSGIAVQPLPQMYVPVEQSPELSMAVVVRTAGEASGVASAMRRELFTLDPNQPLYDVTTMEQRLASSVAQPRFEAVLLGIFAGLALALAAVGIYGVIAQSVVQRTHEIGIRMALGAEPHAVLWQVMMEGMALAGAGIASGLAGTLVLSRVLASLLFEVRGFDPATFSGASLLLAAVAFAGCYIPARRAARVDPMIALRWE